MKAEVMLVLLLAVHTAPLLATGTEYVVIECWMNEWFGLSNNISRFLRWVPSWRSSFHFLIWLLPFLACLYNFRFFNVQSNLDSETSPISNNFFFSPICSQKKCLGCQTKLRFSTWQPIHADTCMISFRTNCFSNSRLEWIKFK